MKKRAAPIIAAVLLLLLPVLYVGSYFILVMPQPRPHVVLHRTPYDLMEEEHRWSHYRVGEQFPAAVFWPLEQLDRMLRPKVWLTPIESSASP